jgi:uracil-DNA glycosylase
MSEPYSQLLDATIRHLETLKGRGVRHVGVSADTLGALAAPAATTVPRPPATDPGSVPAKSPSQEALLRNSRREEAHTPRSAEGQSLLTSAATVQASNAQPPADKEAAMAELRSRALACTRCPHLVKSRRQVVFGVGDVHATLMFVGEAPGADEDAQGEPFVGAAGQLLTRIIQTMGLSRQTVYIANILKCRPDTPGQSSGNRPPTEEEMETCIPYLLEQIDVIRPKVIVALGATAVKGLLHSKIGISKLRGQWQVFRGIPTLPTYHPAYLLRNQALSEKRKVWEDMLKVMEKLGLPITDKQRGYFLKSGS